MKYVIKRVIIAVLSFLAIMLIKQNVFAQVYSGSTGGKTVTVSTYSNDIDFTLPNALFQGLGHGTIYFSFGTQKTLGGSGATSEILIPRQAFVTNGANTTNYICQIGSTTSNNSTYQGGTYSVSCPFNSDLSGIGYIHIRFMNADPNDQSNYYVVISGPISFVTDNTSFLGTINQNTSSINSSLSSIDTTLLGFRTEFFNNIREVKQNQATTNTTIQTETQKQIDSQKVCSVYDMSSGVVSGSYIDSDGDVRTSANWTLTDYIPVTSSDTLTVVSDTMGNAPATCFYNINKTKISCVPNTSLSNGYSFTIPQDTSYVRFSISLLNNRPQFKICKNGNTAIVDSQNQINNTLNDDTTTEAETTGSDFFNNFSGQSHGVSGIVTAPLRLLQSFTTANCQPLQFQMPFTHNNVSLSCMRPIYETHFPVWFTFYQMLTTGIIGYMVMINIFAKVHDLQNPQNDRIEVLSL